VNVLSPDIGHALHHSDRLEKDEKDFHGAYYSHGGYYSFKGTPSSLPGRRDTVVA